MSSSAARTTPCRVYSQGRSCRFGDRCRFSHDADPQLQANPLGLQPGAKGDEDTQQSPPSQPRRADAAAPQTASTSQAPCPDISDARPGTKRKAKACRAWKAGNCTKGDRCWFRHDVDIQMPGSDAQKSCPSTVEQEPSAPSGAEVDHAAADSERSRAAREREDAIARKEAAKTVNQLVLGSIVTYSAGLDVSNLITAFETCTVHIRNLPSGVKGEDVHALIMRQGLTADRFHLTINKKRPEAYIVTDVATGRMLVSDLNDTEFEEKTLVVDMNATNSFGMNAASGQSSDVLTISWRLPSACYVAEYVDIDTARVKVEELNRSTYAGRRIKVQMNTQPRGRIVPKLRLNAIKLDNLPLNVTDGDVLAFTDSISVKRLHVGGACAYNTVEHMVKLVRRDIEQAVPGGLKQFDDPPDACTTEGAISVRAHFHSWDDAKAAHTSLSSRSYGIWLRLLDPMYFTLPIPVEQYKAQKEQWDALSSSIKDKKACALNVRESGKIVFIRLSGSVKEATGALKVRVENLARGDKVEGWHRSLGFPGNQFVHRVYSDTGAYLRADFKRHMLKVYGTSRAVDRAREIIKDELDRLASLDHTVTLARSSVGFFVREGIQQLKDTLGEDNVRFVTSSRKITVSGGEEARHALDRLITLSHKGGSNFPSASSSGQTCPVCTEQASSPYRLGCGHSYCVACLRHLILSALESEQLPLMCPGDEDRCHVPIPIPTIEQFTPPATFERMLEAAFDAYIAKHPEEFKHCRTPDCTQIYRAAETAAAAQTLHCPSCFSGVCNGCYEDAHDGLSCAESRKRQETAEHERLNDAWITEQGGRVKKCPRCSVPIEKTEGCNHVTCRCEAHICWQCMGVFSAETIYPHMHTVHRTIHGNGPAEPVPPVDIGFAVDLEQQRELLRQFEMRRAMQNVNGAGPERQLGYGFHWRPGNQEMLLREREAEAEPGMLRLHEIQQEQDRRRREELEFRVREQRQVREEEERRRREQLERNAREQQERYAREQQERYTRAQREFFEAQERRRREQERQNEGWGCTIM